MSRPKRYMMIFGVIVIVVGGLFWALPSAFLPEDDQGVMYVQIQAPPGGTAERTENLIDEVNNYLLKEEGSVVEASFTVNGYNFAGRGQNSAIHFIRLKPFSERSGYEMSAYGLSERMLKRFAEIKDAKVIPIVPPPIRELGNATGFNLYLQDNAEVGHAALMTARDQFLEMANKDPALKLVRPNGLSDQPQYEVKIDDEKARAHQVSIADINQTMSAAWGSVYVNDFIDRGRVKRVYVQGIQDARTSPEDFNKWYVRNAQGKMVPFSAFATGRWIFGSPKLERYKGIPAVEIMGQPAAGYSSGDAMAAVDRIAAKLPNGVGMAYTGLSYEERLVGSQSAMLLGLSLLVVFLCLAALYESWSIPVSVMLVVPLGVLGAVIATHLRGLSNDVFFQIGLLTTMGLSAKNAILIVEVAKELYEKEGLSLREAAALSARMRLRPIIMTSLAFILGTVPLVIASGAGSGSQHSIGTGVVGGTLAATFLAIYYVPLFYVVVAGLFEKKKKNDDVSSVSTVEEVK